MDVAVSHIDMRLEPYKANLIREINRDDILKLMQIAEFLDLMLINLMSL